MIAHEGDEAAVGRKLGVVAGSRTGKSHLHTPVLAHVVEPETAVRVEEQMRRVRRPQVAGHFVAVAMVAVGLRVACAGERSQPVAAHQHLRLGGNKVQLHQRAVILKGQVLAVGRPGELVGRMPDQRPMREDRLHGQRLLRGLRIEGKGCERKSNNGKEREGGCAHQEAFLREDRLAAKGKRRAGFPESSVNDLLCRVASL